MSTENTSLRICPGVGGVPPPELAHPFKVIALDWDGTAVVSRREDATRVRDLMDHLLIQDVVIVIITGTNFANIDRQFSEAIHGPQKRNLYILTNRGSEVTGFDAADQPVLLYRRVATPEEDCLLTEIADTVRDTVVAETGLQIDVIYDRLNRRKIDLIPVPEWRDPPKSMIGELLKAVQARLKGAGLSGGIQVVFDLAGKVAREKGLTGARITSDVKHIEVGLTDKSDAIAWMMRELAQKRGIPSPAILIAGDEFGPIAGFPGSDAKMLTPDTHGAVVVSVGREPNGVPAGVLHLGGGPKCFRALLADQVVRHQEPPLPDVAGAEGVAPSRLALPVNLTGDPVWRIVEEGFMPAREHEIESLFAIANGYVGTRASLAEGSAFSKPATFVAGVFTVNPQVPIPELAVMPDWTHLRVMVGGLDLRLEQGELLEHRRVLDLRQGIFWRDWRHRDSAGRISSLRFLRLVSLADRHILFQSVTLIPENYCGRVGFESTIPQSRHAGEPNSSMVLEPLSAQLTQRHPGQDHPSPATVCVTVHTIRDVTVAFTSTSQLWTETGKLIEPTTETGDGSFTERWEWDAEIGMPVRLDRTVISDISQGAVDPDGTAAGQLGQILAGGAEPIIDAHRQAWAARWQEADLVVEGDEASNLALRFAIYHLVSAANPEDEQVSIGARSLTGEAYKGHVFWDTEIFMFPFYLYTYPPAARALLMYRAHTLPAARAKAQSLGYRGALFAWESADTGEETTPRFVLAPTNDLIQIRTGEQEHHISAAVAYAVWHYWEVTGDDAFLLDTGAEILLETARFWASRGQLESDGRYHIRHVIGPDEYHEGVDDNAYTNGMAKWNLECGIEVAQLIRDRWPTRWHGLAARLMLTDEDLSDWLSFAAAMETGYHPDSGLFEQFHGYFDLEDIDLRAYEARTVPMDVLLGPDRIQQSQVLKQADVVMLHTLLWDHFSSRVREANFRYYEPRTGHGSSLSPAIHALVAARLGDIELAERYFHQAATVDLGNTVADAAGGVHAGALGGLWQAAVLGFAGLQSRPEGLALDPHLPPRWQSLQFRAQWRGGRVLVRIGGSPVTIEVCLEKGNPFTVALVGGSTVLLSPGWRYRASRDANGWGPWREVSD